MAIKGFKVIKDHRVMSVFRDIRVIRVIKVIKAIKAIRV